MSLTPTQIQTILSLIEEIFLLSVKLKGIKMLSDSECEKLISSSLERKKELDKRREAHNYES